MHLLRLLSDNFFEFVFVFEWEHDPKQHCEPWNSMKAKVFATILVMAAVKHFLTPLNLICAPSEIALRQLFWICVCFFGGLITHLFTRLCHRRFWFTILIQFAILLSLCQLTQLEQGREHLLLWECKNENWFSSFTTGTKNNLFVNLVPSFIIKHFLWSNVLFKST